MSDLALLLLIPDYPTAAEAAALPCAGVTAWSAIVRLGGIKQGDTVLVQGMGGVAALCAPIHQADGRAGDPDILVR